MSGVGVADFRDEAVAVLDIWRIVQYVLQLNHKDLISSSMSNAAR